jgi:hypothetical protein
MCSIAVFLVIMTAYVIFENKTQKNPDRIVNIDKEKYEINSLHVYSCYDITCKEIFLLISVKVIKMEAIIILIFLFFTYYKNCECIQ